MSSPVRVFVRPAALFSIFSQYLHRNDVEKRAIGALLGHRLDDAEGQTTGTILEIQQALPVPHSEVADQVTVNTEYLRGRLDLVRKGWAGKEPLVVLGWYAFGSEASVTNSTASESMAMSHTLFIHDIFGKELSKHGNASPSSTILLEFVLPEQISPKAFLKTADGFKEITCTLESLLGDSVALDILRTGIKQNERDDKTGESALLIPIPGQQEQIIQQVEELKSAISLLKSSDQNDPNIATLITSLQESMAAMEKTNAVGLSARLEADGAALGQLNVLMKTQVDLLNRLLLSYASKKDTYVSQ